MTNETKLKYLEYCDMDKDVVGLLSCFIEYKDLVDFCLYVLESEPEYLKANGMKVLLDVCIKKIWTKYNDDKVIDINEVKVFLGALFTENVELLEVDNSIVKREFVPCDHPKLEGREACCIHTLKRDDFLILFSNSIIEKILNNPNLTNLFIAMMMVGHEQVHIMQNSNMSWKVDLKTFIYSLEQLASSLNIKFYKDNHEYLKLELDASVIGVSLMVNFLGNHKLLNREGLEIFEKVLKEDEKDFNKKFEEHQVLYNGTMDLATKQMFYINQDFLKRFNFYLEHFPILRISYNTDGSLKSVSELVRDRKKLIDDNNPNLNNYEEIYGYIFDKCYGINLDEAIQIEKKDSERPKSLFKRFFDKRKKI